MKLCKSCLEIKPLTEFYKDKSFKSGYRTNCKSCKDKSTYKWRENNRQQYNEKQRLQHKKNYTRNRLYRYKLTPEQYKKMLEDQNHVCAICKCSPKGKRPLVVDHRHSDGKVRGLLCYGCNRALHVLESVDLLQKAQDYLKKHK